MNPWDERTLRLREGESKKKRSDGRTETSHDVVLGSGASHDYVRAAVPNLISSPVAVVCLKLE